MDSDGDLRSDPDDATGILGPVWLLTDGGDAFRDEPTQWSDEDLKMAMVTTRLASHQMTAQPFVTPRPSTDLVALIQMVTAIRILMQRGQSQMVQMHASTAVETRPKIESDVTMKMATGTQTQALTGPLTTALMPMSKTQLVGLRKPLQMQTAFPADFQSFTVLVELF